MLHRLPALLLILTVGLAGLAPAEAQLASGMEVHACCRTMKDADTAHGGCSQPASMSCCAPTSERDTSPQAPPAQAPSSHHPDFTLLKGHAAHVPGLPALIRTAAAHAFETARLKLPHEPLYLRNLVLLV